MWLVIRSTIVLADPGAEQSGRGKQAAVEQYLGVEQVLDGPTLRDQSEPPSGSV
jgi:hypothetical protein